MRSVERVLVPLAAVATFAALLLFRWQPDSTQYLPREAELATLLRDLGHVRAWSVILGDRDAPPLPSADGDWGATAHYLLTWADGRTSLLSAASRTYGSGAEAGTAFERLAAQLGVAGAAARPAAYAGAAEPEQRQDFGGVRAAAGGWQPDARARLLREGRVVTIVRLVASPAGGGRASNWHDGQLALERTVAWVQDRMLTDRVDPA